VLLLSFETQMVRVKVDMAIDSNIFLETKEFNMKLTYSALFPHVWFLSPPTTVIRPHTHTVTHIHTLTHKHSYIHSHTDTHTSHRHTLI